MRSALTPARQLVLIGLLLVAGGLRSGARARPGGGHFAGGVLVAAPVVVPASPPAALAGPGARRAVAPPTADHRLDRPPSVSAARIDAVLAGYGSPAVGQGPVLYDLGVEYGIDPAYCLAWFVVESAASTRGVARQTHSIGNIRCTPGYACVAGYRAYANWDAGARDWYALIHDLYIAAWGLRTPAAILPRYAPASDGNDPDAYAASVIALVDGWAR